MDKTGKKLSSAQTELYKRTDEVLHYIWDPIEVSDSAYARDEYWGYLPHVFSLLVQNKSKNEILEYLLSVELDSMGLTPNRKNAERVVEILYEYKEKILNKNL